MLLLRMLGFLFCVVHGEEREGKKKKRNRDVVVGMTNRAARLFWG
jgi:hypothetical protein